MSALGGRGNGTWWACLVASMRAARASVYAMLLGRALVAAVALVVLAALGSHFERPLAGSVADEAGVTIAIVPAAHAAESVGSPSALEGPPLTDAGATTPAPPEASPESPSTATPSRRATPESPVFLNLATEVDLRRLPGVGSKRADAILALRKKLGRFRRVEELMRVKGIGRAAVRKWRPLVRLDAPSEGADAGASP